MRQRYLFALIAFVYVHFVLYYVERRLEVVCGLKVGLEGLRYARSIRGSKAGRLEEQQQRQEQPQERRPVEPPLLPLPTHDRYRHAYNCANYECAPRDIPACSWSHGAWWHDGATRSPYAQPSQLHHPYTAYVRALNRLNVRYYLYSGSGLGAYRNGGVIAGDADMDIVMPVWLNYALLANDTACDDAQRTPPVLRNLQATDEAAYTLCGATRRQWVTRAVRFFAPRLVRDAMQAVGGGPHNAKLTSHGMSHVDLVVSIWDWQLIAAETSAPASGLCRCEFSGVEALCIERQAEQLRRHFGPLFHVPNARVRSRMQADEGVFPDKPIG